jgi:flagellar hook-basal body complex protein FliE
MSTRISSALPALSTPPAAPASGPDSVAGFGETLRGLLDTVNTKSGEANQAIGKMIDGTGDVHEAMIAMQQANMMLELTVQVRNKLVQAYQDVMRMPV